MSNGKIITFDQAVIDTFDQTTPMLFPLKESEAIILLAMIPFIRWRTRWTNLTMTPQELNQLSASIAHGLMNPQEAVTVDAVEELRIVNQILEYRVGSVWIPVGDVVTTCNEIVACMSPITSNLQGQIDANETGIAQNTAQLVSQQLEIVDLQNRMTGAETDISDITLSIQQINILLSDVDQRTVINTNNITNLDNRVTILENASGGGGNVTVEEIQVKRLIFNDTLTADTLTWTIQLDKAYDLIFVEASIAKSNNGGSNLDMTINGNPSGYLSAPMGGSTFVNFPRIIQGLGLQLEVNIMGYLKANNDGVTGVFESALPYTPALYNADRSWASSLETSISRLDFTWNNGNSLAGSNIKIYAIETVKVIGSTAPPANGTLIDFDNIIPTTQNINGGSNIVASGGITGNCLEVSQQFGVSSVKLSGNISQDVSSITVNLYTDDMITGNIAVTVLFNTGVSQTENIVPIVGQWATLTFPMTRGGVSSYEIFVGITQNQASPVVFLLDDILIEE